MSPSSLGWLLCCCALLSPAAGYVLMSSVSWAVPNEVDEELDSASTEEALPALLEDPAGLWQRSFPAAAAHETGAPRAPPRPAAAPGMFSYRRERRPAPPAAPAAFGPAPRARLARSLAHANSWGCVAAVAARDKLQGLPFGSCLLVSDGPFNNGTGTPFFYVTARDPVVADLMKNPMASLMLPESEGEFCSGVWKLPAPSHSGSPVLPVNTHSEPVGSAYLLMAQESFLCSLSPPEFYFSLVKISLPGS
ncbi:protein CREG2 isoform X2 [Cavia porcellus]|uniref:protein CREG2 isoform X2 n=1 Tax=Cavia porcellus TaxID=10141 RepID=UPI002FE304DD